MKHTLKITVLLVLLFFFSQVIGLLIVNKYIDHMMTEQTGNVTWVELPMGVERPQMEESSSYIYIFIAILIGTLLVFALIKTKAYRLWKLWFFIAVVICLTIAIGALLPQYVAFALALALAFMKIFRRNIYIHNITETFIYGGLAAILVPVINLYAMFILLALISLYDMYAVWQSKHMVTMAKFQTESKMFAGLLIPYGQAEDGTDRRKDTGKNASKNIVYAVSHTAAKAGKGMKSAILGGGDMGFPLLFAGVVMKGLMLHNTVFIGFIKSLIIPSVVSIALIMLFLKSQKDKFYPAMPFLSMGCVIGYLIVAVIG